MRPSTPVPFVFLMALAALTAAVRAQDGPSENTVPAKPGEAVIITPEKLVPLRVRVADTPEAWHAGLKASAMLEENEGLLLLYTTEAVRSYDTEGLHAPLDLLFINKSGRILEIVESAIGPRHEAANRPIIALLALPAGFCRDTEVSAGGFFSLKGRRLGPKAPAASKRAGEDQVEARLLADLQRFPDDPDVAEALAVFHLASGKVPEAKRLLEALIRKEATAARLNGLGIAHMLLGEKPEAEQRFKEAIRVDPFYLGSYQHLLRIQPSDQVIDDVTSLLEAAIESRPDFTAGRLALSRLWLVKGDLDRASKTLEGAERTPDVERALGDIALRRGDQRKAAEHYLAFLKKRPYDPHASELDAFIMVHKIKPEQKRKKTP